MIIIDIDGGYDWVKENSIDGREWHKYSFHRKISNGPSAIYKDYTNNTYVLEYWINNRCQSSLTKRIDK